MINKQKKTILFFEKYSYRTTCLIARKAMEMGYQPIVILDESAPMMLKSEEPFKLITISDWSDANLWMLTQEFVAKYPIIGITSILGFFTGQGLLAHQLSKIAVKLGLPHINPESLLLTNNKFLMRRKLQQEGVYTVRHHWVQDEETLLQACEKVGFPLILKPIVGLGSSFISYCENIDQARQRYSDFLNNIDKGMHNAFFEAHEYMDESGERWVFDPRKQMLAEEAINGFELSVECLCTEDQVYPLMVHDKLDVQQDTYCSFENLLITPPARFDRQAEIKQYATDVLHALGLTNNFSHVELCLDCHGRPSIIEANPRIGGMRIVQSLKDVMDIDYPENFIKLVVGEEITAPETIPASGYFAMAAVYPKKSGVLKAVHGVEEARNIPGIQDIAIRMQPGSHVGGDYEETFVVDAWLKSDSPEEIIKIDERFRALVKLEVTMDE